MPDLLDDVASDHAQPDLLDDVASQQQPDQGDAAAAQQMREGPPPTAKGPSIPDPGMREESVGRAVFGPAQGAVDAVKQVPGVGLLGGKKLNDPLTGTIDTEKRGAATFKEGLDLLGPDNFADNSAEGFKRTARGFTKLADGAMTMSSPALAAEMGGNPASIIPIAKGIITGSITGAAAQKITKAAGFSQDYQDLAKTVGFFIPTAAGAMFGATESPVKFGEGTGTVTDYAAPKGATGPGSGRVSTFTGSNPQEFTAGARVGGRTFGIRIPRGRAAAPGAAGPDVLPPPPSPGMAQAASDAKAAAAALNADQAATQAAQRTQAGIPPPEPPKPAGMDQGELRPGTVSDAAKLIQMAPENMRGPMMLEAHGNLTKWLATNGKVIMPDGKIQIIDSPDKAAKVAQDLLNSEVDRHQQAFEQQKADRQKAAEDAAKQQQEGEEATIEQAGQPGGEEEEENPVVARARTILAANANAPQSRQLALLQRQLRVGPGMANQLLRQAQAGKAAAMAGGMVGSSTEPVTPEPNEQVDAQIQSLAKGTVPVVFLPEGSKYKPAIPPGMKAIKVSGADTPGAGTYVYNPTKIQAAAIKEAAKNGTHGDLLGHINDKGAITGMKVPAILQAKTADGTPIQESVVDGANPQEVRDQAAALRERHPDAHIQIRHPEAALNERDHLIARSETGGGDIFDHIAQERGKGESNAVQKQGTARVLSQPGREEGSRSQGSEGVRPGEQGAEKPATARAGEAEVNPVEGGPRKPEPAERRQDTERRRRVAEMSPEEMRQELQTSEKTGLPNRRAFEEAADKGAVGMSDADGLKAFNDRFGYESGDKLLRAKADALREAGVEAYHDKGDEFLYRGETPEKLRAGLDKARDILRDKIIEVRGADGTTKQFKGADFSHGTGKDIAEAERGLKQHKAEREDRGERRRGELRGFNEAGPETGQEREGAAIKKGDAGVRFKDDKGVERAGTVAHTNERVTRLRANDGKEYTVKTAGLKPAADITPGSIGELHSSQIHLAPKDFQYKVSNIGAEGVSSLLEGSEWNPDLSGIVSVWRDPENGKFYAVNGHHRTQRARQTGGQTLAVRHLVAENRAEARAIGALQNIAEGRGTAVDAAKFLRDSGISLEDLEKKGISMGEATAQNGVALSRLEQSLFDRVATGKLSERKGIAIGRATDNPATQEAIVKMIDKAEARGRHVSDATVQELARFAASAGEKEQTVSSLFGDRVETQNLALEKAEASAYVQKQLRAEKSLFGAVSSEARAKTLARTGNKITAEKNAKESEAAMQALEVYDRLSARRGPVDDLLNQAAKDLADGKPAARTKSELYDGIRAAVRESLGGVQGKSPRRSAPSADRPSNVTPEKEEDGDGRLSAEELEAVGQNGLAFSLERPTFTRDNGPVNPPLTPADPFYLKSSRVVAQKMRGPMKGTDLIKMLENAGVKADELKWTGLQDLVGEAKVTPDQVREVLNQDRVELIEDLKGDIHKDNLPDGWKIQPNEDGDGYEVLDNRGVMVGDGPDRQSALEQAQRQNRAKTAISDTSKYSGYQLRGGENYREMLMQMPAQKAEPTAQEKALLADIDAKYVPLSKEWTALNASSSYEKYLEAGSTIAPDMARNLARTREIEDIQERLIAQQKRTEDAIEKRESAANYKSPHWDEPNVLTHIRFNDRTDADGRKLLHLEEVQSDWHQKGRDKGYREGGEQLAPRPTIARIEKKDGIEWIAYDEAGKLLTHVGAGTEPTEEGAREYMARYLNRRADERDADMRQENYDKVPDAPFKKTWHELALRRMLRYAAENGYDGLSWTPGEKQAERYDLSKQVGQIDYTQHNRLIVHDTGRNVIHNQVVPEEKLEDYIGKEATRKLLETEPRNHSGLGSAFEKSRTLTSPDLKLGGEGMKGFYDKIIPDYLGKYGKQWGAKVGETKLSIPLDKMRDKYAYEGPERTRQEVEAAEDDPHSLAIVNMQSRAVAALMRRNRSFSEAMAEEGSHTLAEYFGGKMVEPEGTKTQVAPYLPVTDAMRKSVMEEGQPLFSRAKLDATPEQQARAQRLTTSDPKFPYLDRPGIAKLYQKNLRGVLLEGESATLPGFEPHVEEHEKSAAEVSSGALEQRGVKDISRATREIEQKSPLFEGSAANDQGALFSRPKPPQPGTGQGGLDFSKAVEGSGFKEMSESRREAFQHDLHFRASSQSIDRNLAGAKVTVHPPAREGAAPLTEINADAYVSLRKLLPEFREVEWAGVYINPKSTQILYKKLMISGSQRDGAMELFKQLSAGETPSGSLVIVRADATLAAAREELAHSWWNDNVAKHEDGENALLEHLHNAPQFLQGLKILDRQGYPIDRMPHGTLLNEIVSKMLADAGGSSMPLSPADVKAFLGQMLDVYANTFSTVTLEKAFDTLPEIAPEAKRILDDWRAQHADNQRDALSARGPEEGHSLATTQGDGASGTRGPPAGQDSGLLFSRERQPGESRGRDEVARQRDLPDEGADEEMSPLDNFVGALTDYIRSDSELDTGKLQRGIMRETRGQMDRRIAQTAVALDKDRMRWAGRSHDAFLKFADAVEKVGGSTVADLDPKDQKLAQYFQDQYWKRIETIRALKEGALQDLIENYISHNWERPGVAEKAFKQVFSGRRPFAGRGSFLKQRTIPTIREGIELGLRPKTWNPVEDFLHKILEMDRFIMGHQTLMGMKQAGTAKMIRVGDRAPDGWLQLDDRIGTVQSKSEDGGLVVRGHYYAPADAAKPFNNFVSRGIAGRSNIYDALRWANNNINALQLGISFFHAMTTTNNAIASDVGLSIQEMSKGQVISGAGRMVRAVTMVPSVVQTFRNGSKLMAEYLSPGSYEKFAKEADALASAGGRVKMDVVQPKPLLQIVSHFRNGEVFRGAGKSLGSIIHATTYPVLEYWVPRMKVGAFYADAHSVLKYAKDKNWTPERTRMEMQKAWDSADHRFGQVVYDNLFWHKALRDVLQLSQRAVGWNYGTAAGVGGAIPEAARAAGRVATGDVSEFGTLFGRAMSFVVGMTVATGLIGALLEYHWNGHGPRSSKDFFYPQRADGQRVNVPGYMKDVVAFAHAPVQTVLNKLAPVFSTLAELYQNKDFYRVEIRHADDNWLQQSEDTGKFLAKSLEPFSVSSQQKMIQNQGAGVDTGVGGMWRAVLTHPEDAVLGQLGFQPAAAYVQNTPAQNLAYEFSVSNSPPGTRTQAQFERSQVKQAITAMHRAGKVDTAQINEYIRSGKITRHDADLAAKNAKVDPLVGTVKHGELTLPQMLDVFDKGNARERKLLRPILERKAQTYSEPDRERRLAVKAKLRQALGHNPPPVTDSDSLWETISTHR
jgi:GGDEF domain-containing protein